VLAQVQFVTIAAIAPPTMPMTPRTDTMAAIVTAAEGPPELAAASGAGARQKPFGPQDPPAAQTVLLLAPEHGTRMPIPALLLLGLGLGLGLGVCEGVLPRLRVADSDGGADSEAAGATDVEGDAAAVGGAVLAAVDVVDREDDTA
jgi:hypothetical protein